MSLHAEYLKARLAQLKLSGTTIIKVEDTNKTVGNDPDPVLEIFFNTDNLSIATAEINKLFGGMLDTSSTFAITKTTDGFCWKIVRRVIESEIAKAAQIIFYKIDIYSREDVSFTNHRLIAFILAKQDVSVLESTGIKTEKMGGVQTSTLGGEFQLYDILIPNMSLFVSVAYPLSASTKSEVAQEAAETKASLSTDQAEAQQTSPSTSVVKSGEPPLESKGDSKREASSVVTAIKSTLEKKGESKNDSSPVHDVTARTDQERALEEVENFLFPPRYWNPHVTAMLAEYEQQTGLKVTCYQRDGYIGFNIHGDEKQTAKITIKHQEQLRVWLKDKFFPGKEAKQLDSTGQLVLRQVAPKLMELRGDPSPPKMDVVTADGKQLKYRAMPRTRAAQYHRNFIQGITRLSKRVGQSTAASVEVKSDLVDAAEIAKLCWVHFSNTQIGLFREVYELEKMEEMAKEMKKARPAFSEQIDDLMEQQFKVFINEGTLIDKIGNDYTGQAVTQVQHRGGNIFECQAYFAMQTLPFDRVQCIDVSASMERSEDAKGVSQPGVRIGSALRASDDLFDRPATGGIDHLITFGEKVKQLSPKEGWDRSNVEHRKSFKPLVEGPSRLKATEGYTYTNLACTAAESVRRPGVPQQVVYITDGETNSTFEALEEAAKAAKAKWGKDFPTNVQIFFVSNSKDESGKVVYNEHAQKTINILLKYAGPGSKVHPVTPDELVAAVERLPNYPEVRTVPLYVETKIGNDPVKRLRVGVIKYNEPVSLCFEIPKLESRVDLQSVQVRVFIGENSDNVPWSTVVLERDHEGCLVAIPEAAHTRHYISRILNELSDLGINSLDRALLTEKEPQILDLLQKYHNEGFAEAVEFFNLFLTQPVRISKQLDRTGHIKFEKITLQESLESDADWVKRQLAAEGVTKPTVGDAEHQDSYYKVRAKAKLLDKDGAFKLLTTYLPEFTPVATPSNTSHVDLAIQSAQSQINSLISQKDSAASSGGGRYKKRDEQRISPAEYQAAIEKEQKALALLISKKTEVDTEFLRTHAAYQAKLSALQASQRKYDYISETVEKEAWDAICQAIIQGMPTEQQIKDYGHLPIQLTARSARRMETRSQRNMNIVQFDPQTLEAVCSVEEMDLATLYQSPKFKNFLLTVAKLDGTSQHVMSEKLETQFFTEILKVANEDLTVAMLDRILQGIINYHKGDFASSFAGQLFSRSGQDGKIRAERLQQYIASYKSKNPTWIGLSIILHTVFATKIFGFQTKVFIVKEIFTSLGLKSDSPFLALAKYANETIAEEKLTEEKLAAVKSQPMEDKFAAGMGKHLNAAADAEVIEAAPGMPVPEGRSERLKHYINFHKGKNPSFLGYFVVLYAIFANDNVFALKKRLGDALISQWGLTSDNPFKTLREGAHNKIVEAKLEVDLVKFANATNDYINGKSNQLPRIPVLRVAAAHPARHHESKTLPSTNNVVGEVAVIATSSTASLVSTVTEHSVQPSLKIVAGTEIVAQQYTPYIPPAAGVGLVASLVTEEPEVITTADQLPIQAAVATPASMHGLLPFVAASSVAAPKAPAKKEVQQTSAVEKDKFSKQSKEVIKESKESDKRLALA